MINEGPRRLRDGKREMGSRSRKTERMPRERGMGFCFGHVTSQKEAPLYPHSKSWRKGKACDGFFVRCYHGHVNIWFLRKFKITHHLINPGSSGRPASPARTLHLVERVHC